ncbi:MAG: hypothetical protein HRT89_24405 [Lentisphaeria bacterium]|nr:hypothetical protein [Lentisphaeria bacterium]NQZ71200.1 hypothetical protein [Lentisphaeria bacterium]
MIELLPSFHEYHSCVLHSSMQTIRNLNKYPFLHKLGSHQKDAIADELLEQFQDYYSSIQILEDEEARKEIRELLQLKVPISDGMVLHTANYNTYILVNIVEHLYIQKLLPGLQIVELRKHINHLVDHLSLQIDFAYNENFGFLCSKVAESGSAARFTCLAHLPGLHLSNQLTSSLKALSYTGIMNKELTKCGHFLQFSASASISADAFERHMNKLIEAEKNARQLLLEKNAHIITDSISRSCGILNYCHEMSYAEMLEHLSMVLLGHDTGIVNGVNPLALIKCIIEFSDSQLELEMCKTESSQIKNDIFRASKLKAVFA